MLPSVSSAEAYLASLPVKQRGSAARLATVRETLGMLGNPQNTIPAIHIAGTSGKGSTAHYAASLLCESGYTVGLAVSPHIHSVTERSQVNGTPLPATAYCSYFSEFTELVTKYEWRLTYLEFLTIFNYWLFAQLRLDYIVIEVGVGGRLDPTNAISRKNTVRVITDIGFDHTDILGNTLPEIAAEKAGIIHTGDRVVMHHQPQEIMDTIAKIAGQVRATLIPVRSDTIPGSALPAFQQRNWTLACQAVNERLRIDRHSTLPKHALQRSQQITIPGRFEQYIYNGTPVILDVAHNAQKLSALTRGIAAAYPATAPTYVVAFGNNKQAVLESSIAVLTHAAGAIIATNFPADTTAWHPCIPAATIVESCVAANYTHAKVVSDAWQAFEYALQRGAPVVVTGSFYLIDGIRTMLIFQGLAEKVDN